MIKLAKLAQDLQVAIGTLYRWRREGTITVVESLTGRLYVTEEEYTRITNGKKNKEVS